MASTVTIDAQPGGRTVHGNRKVRKGTLTLGNPYATNGIAVTAAQFEFYGDLEDLDIRPAGGYVFEWDKANAKVKAYDQKDPAAAGGADIALPECGAIDLSSVSARFRAVGW